MNSKILNKIRVGAQSSDFTLLDANKKKWQLSTKLGQVVALLFYPGNETLVCTKQLCSIRDNWQKYLNTGAEIIAISPANENEQKKFAANHQLPMPLLADASRLVTNVYGKHRFFPIWTTRAVIVIDAKGFVRYQNIMLRALRPSDDEVLAAIHLAKYDMLTDRRLNIQPV